MKSFKKKVRLARQVYARREQDDQQAVLAERNAKRAAKIKKELAEHVEALEAASSKIVEALKPLLSIPPEDLVFGAPIAGLKDGEERYVAFGELVKSSRAFIEKELLTQSGSGTLGTVKVALERTKSKVASHETLLKEKLEAARNITEKLLAKARQHVAGCFRQMLFSRGFTLDVFFSEMLKESSEAACLSNDAVNHTIAYDLLKQQFERLEGLKMSSEQALSLWSDLGVESISRFNFLRAFQQYYECTSSTRLTSELELNKDEETTAILPGQVIELLEEEKCNKRGDRRIYGRTVSDGKSGWISVSSSTGASCLKEIQKPAMVCKADLRLDTSLRSTGADTFIRIVKVDEVLEIIEGPQKVSVTRINVQTSSDKATGWIVSDNSEIAVITPSTKKYYVCTHGITVTAGENTRDSKTVRKLEIGEFLELKNGPVTDEENGLSRIYCRVLKDEVDGWVTIKGNAGTTYAKECDLQTVCKPVALEKELKSGGWETIRTLAVNELIEVVKDQAKPKLDSCFGFKVRTLADGLTGWVSTNHSRFQQWMPLYRSVMQTVIDDSLTIASAKPLRRIEEGEELDVLEGPVKDSEAGLLRIKARAKKDGCSGWITVRGNQGTALLSPCS